MSLKPQAGAPITFILTQGATGKSGIFFGAAFRGGLAQVPAEEALLLERPLRNYHAAIPLADVPKDEAEQRELFTFTTPKGEIKSLTLAEVMAMGQKIAALGLARAEEAPMRAAMQDPDIEVDGTPPPAKPGIGGPTVKPQGKSPGK